MRINIIPVHTLSDVHLQAELREIPLSIHYFKRSKNTKNGINWNKVSKTYALNQGHAMFFFNKYKYILNRYYELVQENKNRGFKTDSIEEQFLLLFNEHINKEVQNSYMPTKDDMYINIERILDRIYEMIYIKNKPKFYKLKGKELKFIDWCIYYTNELELEYGLVYDIIHNIELKHKGKQCI